MRTMKAAVFLRPGKIQLAQKSVSTAGPGEALVKITTTTICGTDIHILTGDYPVREGLTIGHIRDTVVVFAQRPIGLYATVGAKLRGASLIIAVDRGEARLAVSKRLGAANIRRLRPVCERARRRPESRDHDTGLRSANTLASIQGCHERTKS